MFIKFDSAPESLKNQFRGLMIENLYFGLSKRSGTVQVFSLGSFICLKRFDVYCLYLNFL